MNPADHAHPLVLAALEALGEPFALMPCDPALADTAAFCEHYEVAYENTGNTIIVASKRPAGRACACVVTALQRLDVNRKVCDLLEVSKASFASAEEMHALTGMEVGGVTVFGLPGGLPIFIDSTIMEVDEVVLGAGSRTGKVRIAPRSLLKLPGVQVIEGLGLARPAG